MRRRLLAALVLLLAFAPAARVEATDGNGVGLDVPTAERFAKLALGCIDREYPNKPEQISLGKLRPSADRRARS